MLMLRYKQQTAPAWCEIRQFCMLKPAGWPRSAEAVWITADARSTALNMPASCYITYPRGSSILELKYQEQSASTWINIR